MEITAKLIEIFEIQEISPTFKKREFVVEYAENPNYPEFIKFELIQDKCELLDKFSSGQDVEVHFNLKGRKWTSPQGEVKYFNTLQAWRIRPADNGQTEQPPMNEPPDFDQAPPLRDDDIPF